MLINPLY